MISIFFVFNSFIFLGDVYPTSGDCLLYEKQIRNQAREHPGSIGYCPQFDAVDGYLTSREALMCFAKLIGITDREHVVNSTLRKFHMESFANRVIRTYSGGMRRYDKKKEIIFQD